MPRKWSQDAIDDHMLLASDGDEDDWADTTAFDCGLRADGQCSQAGSEHCDFECPNRNSDLFAGSAAWCKARGKNK